MLAVLLLTPLFWLFGPSPYWETMFLAMAAALSTTVVYELARLTSGSRLAGVIAALLGTALPALQFFNRTYFGYLIPCLLLGWLAAYHRRWAWAGLGFGLAFIAYFVSIVPIGLSCLAIPAFHLRHVRWTKWFAFGLSALAPLAFVEGLFFFYTGSPFLWTRSTFGLIWRYSGVVPSSSHSSWTWLLDSLVGSNGWILSILLLASFVAPLVLKRNSIGLALSLTFVGAIIFYVLQAGIGRSPIFSRMLVACYPFLCICTGVVLARGIQSLPSIRFRRLSIAVIVIGLALAVLQTGLFIWTFTKTLNPYVEQWLAKAAQAGRPVRYDGNWRLALFYAHINGVELLVNDKQWISGSKPDQAVLILSNLSLTGISRDAYTVTTVEISSAVDKIYPVLTAEAGIPRRFELWWPSRASRSVKPDYPLDYPNAAFYYSGSGCLAPPMYMNKTMYFYQLVWFKLTTWLGLN